MAWLEGRATLKGEIQSRYGDRNVKVWSVHQQGMAVCWLPHLDWHSCVRLSSYKYSRSSRLSIADPECVSLIAYHCISWFGLHTYVITLCQLLHYNYIYLSFNWLDKALSHKVFILATFSHHNHHNRSFHEVNIAAYHYIAACMCTYYYGQRVGKEQLHCTNIFL